MTIVVARRVRQVLETPLRTQPPVSAAGLLMVVLALALALALVPVLVMATVMATVMAKVAAIPYAA